jgi:hypothetical protein
VLRRPLRLSSSSSHFNFFSFFGFLFEFLAPHHHHHQFSGLQSFIIYNSNLARWLLLARRSEKVFLKRKKLEKSSDHKSIPHNTALTLPPFLLSGFASQSLLPSKTRSEIASLE